MSARTAHSTKCAAGWDPMWRRPPYYASHGRKSAAPGGRAPHYASRGGNGAGAALPSRHGSFGRMGACRSCPRCRRSSTSSPSGRTVSPSTKVELASFSVLKTFNPPPQALEGAPIDGVYRHGKFLDIDADGTHLVFHLARAGWLRWSRPAAGDGAAARQVADRLAGPALRRLRLRPDRGRARRSRSRPTSSRTRAEVPGIARLGPDPLADDFTLERFRAMLAGRRTQIKGLLRDQEFIAGVGNAYSDEILHVAKISPFAIAGTLTPEVVDRLVCRAARHAVKCASRRRRASRRRSSRTPNAPACGSTRAPARRARSAATSCARCRFADTSLQYCATCQTGGKPLADRRMSKLLK